MLNLGGNTMGFFFRRFQWDLKGESVADTIRTVSCYADIVAMRHPKEGAPMVARRKFSDSDHQCRGRRTSASDPDLDRSFDDPQA